MKKLVFSAAAALMLLATSCGGSDKSSTHEFFSQSATDSMMMAFGEVAGASINQQISAAMAADPSVSKEAFMKGLQYVLAADTTESYLNGMMVGIQLQQQILRYNQMGIKPDKGVLLESFKKAFMSDSVLPSIELQALDGEYRRWSDSLTTAKRAYDMEMLESSVESQENIAKGEAYLNSKVAEDPSIKVADSGLAYKIENAGDDVKVNAHQRAVVTYTAKTIDGRTVESYEATPMAIGNRTAGLREGLQMLGKGGKATLYVPGKLAYGVEAPARLGIGPNEMIIYEVEVIDIP